MELVTDEIENAIRNLNLAESDIFRLPDNQAQTLYFDLLEKFVEGGGRRWWWEAFKGEATSITFPDGNGFEKITKLVPNAQEKVWFIVEEDQIPFYPIYDATPAAIAKIIPECYGFEYYLVPKDKNWITQDD